jgi:sulfite reductase beta subunit-like hemoprotein
MEPTLAVRRADGDIPTGDRCPGVLRLHEAADGWMARVRIPGGHIGTRELHGIVAVAALGNGVIELTSRASVQVRGLESGAADEAARLLGDAGLLPSPRHDRVRNILASPVAGRHPDSLAATDELVVALDRALCADAQLAELSGRFLFAVLDGTDVVGPERADVRLQAETLDGQVAFRLSLGGRPTTLVVPAAGVIHLALGAARGWLALAAPAGTTLAGAVDARERLVRHLGGELLGEEATSGVHVLPVGRLVQNDDHVAVTALAPLGRLDIQALGGLAELGEQHGAAVRVSAQRTVTVADLAPEVVDEVCRRLEGLGLLPSADSGWRGLSACAGQGACAKARVDVRAAAARRASRRSPGAPDEHWSGCERGCGRPVGVAVSVTATGAGVEVDTAGRLHAPKTVAEVLALLAGAETA